MTDSTHDAVSSVESDIKEEGGTRKRDLDIEAKLKVIAQNDKIIKSLEDPEKFLEAMDNTEEDQSFNESMYEHGW